MKDLYLTPRGDLSIENIDNSSERLEIDFITSKSNALVINFFLEDSFYNYISETALNVSFELNKPEFNKELRLISGDEYLEQAIKIRLASSLTSIVGNEDVGSRIESIIHSYVDSPNTVKELEKIVKEAIKDLIPNAKIYIQKPNTRYVDYSTNLKVIIIDGDRKININI